MKNIKNFALIPLLIATSFASVAADQVTSQSAADAQKIGVVSASGASSLSALEAELASKAEATGANSYRIISAGGQNKLYGTAEIFN
ncbi:MULTISPECIES: multiple stress resistance protein BhsA [unclassified Serratia (in: enterobacteria)]|uniref:multiple stress resistance protein BhsA n=1 Tax=unclassified Serratia (in: enterobacteria) TaxID=2647522 RepID=UPI0012F3C880|nr:hypothetical protein YERSI8AC_290243 [Enterobacterales bacterium 8AC]